MAREDAFKVLYKHLRKKDTYLTDSRILNFDDNTRKDAIKVHEFSEETSKIECSGCLDLGLCSHSLWKIFTLKNRSGFFFIRNPFTVSGQQKWIQKSLFEYPRKPSITNLDAHNIDIDEYLSRRDSKSIKNNQSIKLCWATLGYNYNWDAKIYSKNHKSEFPVCLKKLAQHITSCLGFSNYQPEATIINYYNLKSSLGCHSDYSEEDKVSPILSISFGQTALFLLGSENKCSEPIAMFVRSGDIVVMSGLCRLAYHAVPCIIQEKIECRYTSSENKDFSSVQESLQNQRINISVRQVFT